MKSYLKGIDYAKFGGGSKPLTDLAIDRYILEGYYGQARKSAFIAHIQAGHATKSKILRACLKGTYGPDAQRAAKNRPARRKSPKVITTADAVARIRALLMKKLKP